MNKILKRALIGLLCLVLALVLVVGGYVLYVVLQYSRIEDNTSLAVSGNAPGNLAKGQGYSAVTYNIGFGAYNHAFSFFMDTGVMQNGDEVAGSGSRAESAEMVQRNTIGALTTVQALNPDFALFQEVDADADRSHHIDQRVPLAGGFPGYGAVYASNFHSAFLYYPLANPIGAVEGGLYTLSRYNIDSAVRRSFPVDMAFPTRFFDLDRCFAVHRLPVEGRGELVLINAHMSAYDEGGLIRAAQMEMLAGALAAERAAGNWVVVGGDYNHALFGSQAAFATQQQVPGWVAVFDDAALPEGFAAVRPDNADTVATCRSTDMPYTAGVNFSAVLDGFIVSDNVEARAVNVDANFEYSDHNPVFLEFTLK